MRAGSEAAWRAGVALAAATLLGAGCAPLAPVPEPAPAPAGVVREVFVPVEVAVPMPEVSVADMAARNFFAYHDRVRQMAPAELTKEFARLDPPANPAAVLEFALALGQTHNPGDTVRALGLLEPLLRSADPGAAPWQPLARLLAARYGEQRRLEEHAERQAQQLRQSQQRLEQVTQQLEALKAIERSLAPRAAASAARASPQ